MGALGERSNERELGSHLSRIWPLRHLEPSDRSGMLAHARWVGNRRQRRAVLALPSAGEGEARWGPARDALVSIALPMALVVPFYIWASHGFGNVFQLLESYESLGHVGFVPAF